MIVLGIETSTTASSVAIGDASGIRAHHMLAGRRGHVEFLVPAILSACAQTGLRPDAFTGVAVGIGPGLFTGMRVGIATAKTIATLVRAPMVGIASLDLLAFGVRHFPGLIVTCLDAGRGEVFSAFYRQVPGGVQRVSEYRAWTPDALVAEVEAHREETLFVGTGAQAHRTVLGRVERAELATTGTQHPSAAHLVELAVPRFEREDTIAPTAIEPLYVRKSDAEIKWEARGVSIERPLRIKIPKRAQEAAAAPRNEPSR